MLHRTLSVRPSRYCYILIPTPTLCVAPCANSIVIALNSQVHVNILI